MYKFGSRPPRSIDSYGVAGLLGDEARVFYESVFNTHSLGRISDLLSARIRKTGMDELKFRALILFAAFEAYRGQISQGSKILKFIGRRDPADLLDPLVIEVGIDGEKIAIGVSFNLRNDVLFDSSGVSKRIEDRKPSTAFETLLLQLYDQSDRMILRHQAEARRVELISLLAIPGKMVKEELEEKPPLEVITLFKETLQEAPKPSTYEALGDVDYTSLLKDESRLREGRPVPKGEALARASNAGELDSKTKVSSRNAKDSSKTNVEGGEADDDQVVKVGGKAKKGGRDLSVKFKGEEQEEAAKNIHFSGAAEEEEEDGEVSFGTSARKAGKRFRSFLKRLTSGTEEDEVVEGAEQPGDPYYRVKHKRDPQGSDL
ncbi:MAG: hypothetical protein ACXVBW_12305, partial [Bdellovibrionota bacterium]